MRGSAGGCGLAKVAVSAARWSGPRTTFWIGVGRIDVLERGSSGFGAGITNGMSCRVRRFDQRDRGSDGAEGGSLLFHQENPRRRPPGALSHRDQMIRE